MEVYGITKRFIIISLGCLFILSPLGAWVVAQSSNSTTTTNTESSLRTTSELLKTISTDNENLPDDRKHPDITITSFKVVDKWWYVLDVQFQNGNTKTYKMIVGDFNNSAEKMVVVVEPGERLAQNNISGIGVPYGVIDELNGGPILERNTDNVDE